jgi:hypothetical protein
MSKIAPGNYIIVNRVNSLQGKTLALNYNGNNQVVTVVDLGTSPTQVWIVKDYDSKTQSVSPRDAPELQIGMGSGVLKVLPAHAYVWTIRETDGIATVQDGGVTVFWGLDKAINKEPVAFKAGTGDEKQNWLFIRA